MTFNIWLYTCNLGPFIGWTILLLNCYGPIGCTLQPCPSLPTGLVAHKQYVLFNENRCVHFFFWCVVCEKGLEGMIQRTPSILHCFDLVLQQRIVIQLHPLKLLHHWVVMFSILCSLICFNNYGIICFVSDIKNGILWLVNVDNTSFNSYLLSLNSINWYQRQFHEFWNY